MKTQPINAAVLREFLDYDAETGKLAWKPRDRRWFSSDRAHTIWNVRFAGKPAFTADSCGYRIGAVFRITLKAHRVIWMIVHGEWPPEDVDHINGVRSDNRLANLRAVSRSVNLHNVAKRSDNLSGVTGVHWHAKANKWAAEIKVDGAALYLGLFETVEAAAEARKRAEAAHGYHENHGRKGEVLNIRTRKASRKAA